jgi:hypothetical protein
VHYDHLNGEEINLNTTNLSQIIEKNQVGSEDKRYFILGMPNTQRIAAKSEKCPLNLNDKFKLITANDSDTMDTYFLSEAKNFIENYVDYRSMHTEYDYSLDLNFRMIIQDLRDY